MIKEDVDIVLAYTSLGKRLPQQYFWYAVAGALFVAVFAITSICIAIGKVVKRS